MSPSERKVPPSPQVPSLTTVHVNNMAENSSQNSNLQDDISEHLPCTLASVQESITKFSKLPPPAALRTAAPEELAAMVATPALQPWLPQRPNTAAASWRPGKRCWN